MPSNSTPPGLPNDADGRDGVGGIFGRHSARADANSDRRRRRRSLFKVLTVFGIFALILVLGLGALMFTRSESYDANIKRIPNAMPTTESRPAPAADKSENWLLIGSDTRAKGTTGSDSDEGLWKPGQQRSDTIMLVHLPSDRKKAYTVSFPRDLWVNIPGYGNNKINAAFSFGGPALLIETIEDMSGVRIDHFGAIDFEGFKTMSNALGGVRVNVKGEGKLKLAGEDALNFVRERKGLPLGDFDRIKRQQAFLKALASESLGGGIVQNPFRMDRFLTALTRSVSVDNEVSGNDLRGLTFSLRSLRPDDMFFLTVPNNGSGRIGAASVVLFDRARAEVLFEAIRSGGVGPYVKDKDNLNQVDTVD